jgi:ParB family chromosome partitioning protein
MSKRSGLGKGLDALIPPDGALAAGQWGAAEPLPDGGIQTVPVDLVDPNPRQPRAPMDEGKLAELAASIREHGVIQPILVTRVGGRYQLIAGERRWRAARLAGLAEVSALVREATSQQMLELALVENVQRADLNVLEEATAYRHLMDDFGLTQEQVAERVGKSRPAVGNVVRLLGLTHSVQAALLDGRIAEGHGRALLRLLTGEAQAAALDAVLRQHLSVRQTEALVDRLLGKQPVRQREPVRPEILAVEDRLRRRLGTRVEVNHGQKGGRIVIHYYSDEELEAILEQMGAID